RRRDSHDGQHRRCGAAVGADRRPRAGAFSAAGRHHQPAPVRARDAVTTQALAGIRVLDLTRLLPGPFATQLLLHHGAEVIKVEDTGAGDYARDLKPLPGSGFGAAFTASNRGKRSVAIDLKQASGVDALLALV